MVGALLAFGYGVSTAVKPTPAAPVSASVVADTPMVPANFSDLAEKVRPGVVNIQVAKKVKNAGVPSRQPLWGPESFRGLLRAFLQGQSPPWSRTAGRGVRVRHEPGWIYLNQ